MNENSVGRLTGKVALVTGGSSGIGAATVKTLAHAGATVVIGYYNGLDRAQALQASLPGTHHVIQLSLDDKATHVQATQWVAKTFGKLDILVNSAGYTQRIAHSDLATLTPDLFEKIVQSILGGTYAITHALMPTLQASADAVVVNMSSVSAFTGSGSNMAYCAAKAGVDTLTQSLARAFGPVRFLAVSPASVDTNFVAGRSRAEVEAKASKTPIVRVVTPEDVADAIYAAVAYLHTATGTRLVIDGGHCL